MALPITRTGGTTTTLNGHIPESAPDLHDKLDRCFQQHARLPVSQQCRLLNW
jgi:hypothetical protein